MEKKILIVDDEVDMRTLLKRALISHNYFVEEADSIRSGIESYKQTLPDIVMLDVNLPDGNGVQHIKDFKSNSKTVVLLMSADNDQLKDNYKEHGANGFLKKPFRLSELLAFILTQYEAST